LIENVNVGDLTIKPSLEKTVENIHPAIGVADDTAYVGVWIPCEVTGKKQGEVAYKDLLFLVTDKRELILANDEVFRKKGLNWRLAYKPIHFPNRWRLKDVQAYLDRATVDPGAVLNSLIEAWQKYMELPSEAEYLYHALWDLGTYFHHLFNCFPYHYIGGVKRSGKTKDLMLHYCLAFNAVFSNNMSTASIYRLIQNARATLLIDETEKLSYKGQMSERTLEFRSILLSGYKKGGKAYRVEKGQRERLEPQAFEVYGPKAVANIQGLEDVMADRCKTTILRRSRNCRIINLEVDENSKHWSELRNQLYVFFLTYWREIKEIYDEIASLSELSELNEQVNLKENTLSKKDFELLVGRELELWKPILTLAVFFQRKNVFISKFTNPLNSLSSQFPIEKGGTRGTSSPLCSLILNLAVEDAKQRLIENITETGESILLQILTQVVEEDNYYPVKTLKEIMANAFDEEQKWLTTRWIGNALRRLGFKEKRRVGTGYQYFLRKRDVADLANRMNLPEPEDKMGDSSVIQLSPPEASKTESGMEKTENQKLGEFRNFQHLKSVYWSDGFYDKHECCVCGYTKLTAWQAETFKGEKLWICEDCKWEWGKWQEVEG